MFRKYLPYLSYMIIALFGLLLTIQWATNDKAMSKSLEKRVLLEQSIKKSKFTIQTLNQEKDVLNLSIKARDNEIEKLLSEPLKVKIEYEKVRASYLTLPELGRDSVFSELLSQEANN